ncbi:MAG: Rrf2 family transcriptional regulator [Cyanobacteria bacterium P01_D01_bin.1]
MKLTTRGHYSVKALLDLSLQPTGSLSSVRQIAERQQLPAPYLEKLLIELRRSHLINSVRGPQGGYCLAKPPAQISLGQILEAVGESASSITMQSADVSTQSQAEDWVTSMLWNRLNQKLQEAFHSITLEDLYYDARSWQAAQGEGASFVV